MVTVTSHQPWEPKQLNQSGIRRLKIVDADSLLILKFSQELVPQNDFVLYEFIFPADLSCVATIQRQEKDTGSVFWTMNISFSLPHMNDQLVLWVADHSNTLWLAIAEDYNGDCRVFGGLHEGLKFAFQTTTGGAPKGTNPMAFAFSGEQLLPYLPLASYEDTALFPNDAAFSYGFSTGFNA